MKPVDSKTILPAIHAFSEAYSAACKPICKELGMPQMAFDILMFLSNNPDHCTAKDISRLRGFKENIISVNANKLVTRSISCRIPSTCLPMKQGRRSRPAASPWSSST